MHMVAEGVETCGAAVALGQKFEVDLPIIQQMHAVLHAAKSPREAAARPDGTVAQRRVGHALSIPAQPSSESSVKKDMEAVAALERDAQLMLRVREGDETSFALLLERHRGPGGQLPAPDGAESRRIGGAGAGSFPAGVPQPGDL